LVLVYFRLESNCAEVVIKSALLLLLQLIQNLGLVHHCLLSLLDRALDGTIHPVFVIASRLQVVVLKFLLDVFPDLPIFQVRVQLDGLHLLLLSCIQLVKVKADSEESGENAGTDVVGFDEVEQQSIHE